MIKNDRAKSSSKNQWPWWKSGGLALFVFGVFAVILAYYPSYSSVAMSVGVGLAFLGVIVSIRTVRTRDWWGQIGYINIWMLLVLGIAIRAWTDVIPFLWLWLILLPGFYLLAWALPVIHPKLSALLLREQLAPETIVGRGCMAWTITLLPVAGGLGAVFGMYGSRYGQDKFVSLAIASLFSMASIGMSQAIAHQSWPKRPWRDETNQEGKVN